MKSVIAGLHRLEREVLPLLQKYSGFEDVVRNSGMQAV